MRLTVFTPAYNRRELLGRAYESLLRQSCRDFEWLIVDDGSSDATDELVGKWIKEDKINIRYYYQENGGKMRAHNRGVEQAKGELFLCLDSDDYLTDTAVEDLLGAYDDFLKEEPTGADSRTGKGLAGIVAHKGATKDKLLGDSDFPVGGRSGLYELYLKGFRGETTLMFVTDVIRKYPFPEIEGEKYVPEDYIYDKIDRDYDLGVLPKIITICEIVEKGYTDSVKKLRADNPRAWYLYFEQRSQITPFGVDKLKYLGRYIIYAYRLKEPVVKNRNIGLCDKALGFMYAAFLKISRKE